MRFIIGISSALFVFSIIGLIALNNFFGADTTSFDAQSLLIWVAVPSVFLLAVIIWLLNRATDS